jgi:hypothetical protein
VDELSDSHCGNHPRSQDREYMYHLLQPRPDH